MSTYNARVPADQQYQLIMECRSSGLTDYQCCKEHGIHPGTFYNWVSCLRKKACHDRNIPWPGDHPHCQWNGSCHAGPDPQPRERLRMLGDISVANNIYIVCGTTDIRKSIDGLCSIIRDKLLMAPDQSSLFLYCGKRCDRIKVLLHEPLSADFCYPHIFSFPTEYSGTSEPLNPLWGSSGTGVHFYRNIQI